MARFNELDTNVKKTFKRLETNIFSSKVYTVHCDGNKMTQVCEKINYKADCYSGNSAIEHLNKEKISVDSNCNQSTTPEEEHLQISSKDLNSACGIASKQYEKVMKREKSRRQKTE